MRADTPFLATYGLPGLGVASGSFQAFPLSLTITCLSSPGMVNQHLPRPASLGCPLDVSEPAATTRRGTEGGFSRGIFGLK